MSQDSSAIQKLDTQASDELLSHLQEIETHNKYNKIDQLYPESGPLRRGLYTKHMQFFKAGKKYAERAAIAGNRCISPWTPIEMGSATRLVSELIGEEDFYVTSWDGSSRCKKKAGGVFLKSIEPMFRLHLDNGQYLDCTIGHLLLTTSGWLSLGQLIRLSDILCCGDAYGSFGSSDYFVPYRHPRLVGDQSISAIEPLGPQPVLDFTVEDTHAYESGGVISHNTGKSYGIGGYEVTLHLTGEYPDWWEGKRFHYPTEIWAAGDTSETTRDIIQNILLGPNGDFGSGLIPKHTILGNPTFRAGVAGAVDTVRVRHVSGGTSALGLKSYDQGRKKFQGTAKDVCIADGELVQMADGSLKEIQDVKAGDTILSINTRGKVVKRKVTNVINNGPRECIELQPKHGPFIRLTPDHEVFSGYTSNNKAPAERALKVAQPYPDSFWPEVTESRSSAWYIWAGLVVSEGCYASKKITNGNVEAIEVAIKLLPLNARVRKKEFKGNHVPDWFLYWDEFWDEFQEFTSSTVSIPDFIFKSSKNDVITFLRWLYLGDGWASGKTIGYATTSRKLATQLSILLLRLGIRSSTFLKRPKNGNWSEQYWVCLSRASEVLKFLDIVGIEGKQEACDKTRAIAEARMASKMVRSSHLRKAGADKSQLWAERSFKSINRSTKIRKKTNIGEVNVYDISVEKEHRLLINNNLVKNCWLDEEPPMEVYTECLTRTMTKNGIMICTFTPLEGLSDVVLMYLPEMAPSISGNDEEEDSDY